MHIHHVHLFLAFRVPWLSSMYLSYIMHIFIVHKFSIAYLMLRVNRRYDFLSLLVFANTWASMSMYAWVSGPSLPTTHSGNESGTRHFDPHTQWIKSQWAARRAPVRPLQFARKTAREDTRTPRMNLRMKSRVNRIFLAKAVPRARCAGQKLTFQRNMLRSQHTTFGLSQFFKCQSRLFRRKHQDLLSKSKDDLKLIFEISKFILTRLKQ